MVRTSITNPRRAFSGRCFSTAAHEVANLVHKAMGAVVIPLPLQAITEEGWICGEIGALGGPGGLGVPAEL